MFPEELNIIGQMQTPDSKPFRKATIIPVGHPSWELQLNEPYRITDSLTFEKVSGLLNADVFSLWRDWISQRERDNLGSIRFALLHYFNSTSQVGREEADSKDFGFKAFLCLRLIKPTKTNFEPIQVEFKDDPKKSIDVFSLAHPIDVWPNVPDAEALNSVTIKDIQRLRELLPAFLDLAKNGPENIRRAVRHFNAGYSEVRDPTIQIVVWCMGIESLFSSNDREFSKPILLSRIDRAVGLKTNIYEVSPLNEFAEKPLVEVGELIEDLFLLRNRFVHGQWIPAEWKAKYPRTSLSGEKVHYADVLRELASFVLRRGVLSYLEERAKAFPDLPANIL
jgi:hypothetical protein